MIDFQKKKQLSILVQIAKVDEDFAEQEKLAIRKIGERYGATQADMDELFSNSDIAESLNPMSVMDKMDFMMDCILVIVADDVVTNSEEYFAYQMASNLAFAPEVVPYLIANKDVSREEMRELMMGYLT
ncbi:MAG: hypothetical protein ACI83W_001692 [Marinoscillum sp.]|jgi:uncharacterized tellurite resistance protein B-like protein